MAFLQILSLTTYARSQSLSNIYKVTHGVSGAHVEFRTYVIKPGEELALADINGPAKITYCYITDDSVFHRADGSGFAYPGLVLRVYWDYSDKPSIDVLLWAFFGGFDRESINYASLPMQVHHWSHMCYLPMPFSKHARVSLLNDGNITYSRSIAFGTSYEKNEKYATEPVGFTLHGADQTQLTECITY